MTAERQDHLRRVLTKGEWVCQSHLRVIERWHPEDDRHAFLVVPVDTNVHGYDALLAEAEDEVSGGIVARHYWASRYSDAADAARAQAVHETLDRVIEAIEALYVSIDGDENWPGAVFKDEILAVMETLREGHADPEEAAAVMARLMAELPFAEPALVA